MNKPTKIITHHALSAKHHTHRDVGQWHRDRWGAYQPSRIRQDIARYAGYHYIINWDGSTEQCRAHDEEGIHCRGQNFSSIGVCFMGNFDNHLPSKAQEKAWVRLYKRIGDGMPVYPHRKYATKSCHGALLPDNYFSRLVGVDRQTELIERLKQLIAQLQALVDGRRV